MQLRHQVISPNRGQDVENHLHRVATVARDNHLTADGCDLISKGVPEAVINARCPFFVEFVVMCYIQEPEQPHVQPNVISKSVMQHRK